MGRLLKECNDQRFIKVQERLFRELGHFLKNNKLASLNVSSLSRKAKIYVSTFYDHFKSIDDAIFQYDHRHDKDIMKLREEIQTTNCTAQVAIAKLLYFISSHKSYYLTYIHRRNLTPIFNMTTIFRPILAQSWSNYGREKFDLCFKIFCGELFGVIFFWGETEHFEKTKIQEHALYLSRLAQNATRRLS